MASAQAWVTVAKSDLLGFLNSDQLDVINAGNKDAGQTDDRIVQVIPAVVAEMRDDIENNGQAVVDANTATVPPGLKSTAVWLCLELLSLSTTITLKLTDEQKDKIKNARERMERVRKGEQKVSMPLTTADPSMQTNGAYAVSQNPVECTREKLSGL